MCAECDVDPEPSHYEYAALEAECANSTRYRAAVLRAAIRILTVTHADLAAHCGVGKTTINRWSYRDNCPQTAFLGAMAMLETFRKGRRNAAL
jgi:hypothetical protein